LRKKKIGGQKKSLTGRDQFKTGSVRRGPINMPVAGEGLGGKVGKNEPALDKHSSRGHLRGGKSDSIGKKREREEKESSVLVLFFF